MYVYVHVYMCVHLDICLCMYVYISTYTHGKNFFQSTKNAPKKFFSERGHIGAHSNALGEKPPKNMVSMCLVVRPLGPPRPLGRPDP